MQQEMMDVMAKHGIDPSTGLPKPPEDGGRSA